MTATPFVCKKHLTTETLKKLSAAPVHTLACEAPCKLRRHKPAQNMNVLNVIVSWGLVCRCVGRAPERKSPEVNKPCKGFVYPINIVVHKRKIRLFRFILASYFHCEAYPTTNRQQKDTVHTSGRPAQTLFMYVWKPYTLWQQRIQLMINWTLKRDWPRLECDGCALSGTEHYARGSLEQSYLRWKYLWLDQITLYWQWIRFRRCIG